MMKLVLASHGTLAEGMKHTARFIVGSSVKIYTLCAYVEDGVSLESQMDSLFGQFSEEDEIVVVTDIFGGSVNNEFLQYLRKRNFWLVAGMNLALVIQLAMIGNTDHIEEKIREAVEAGREMMCFCNPMVERLSESKEEF